MTIFLGTLIIVIFSCAAMGLGLVLGGRPLEGGCGGKVPGSKKCEACPKRRQRGDKGATEKGEAGC